MSCGEHEKAANFDSMFDGSEFNLIPSSQGDCAAKLRLYNHWRRGEADLPDECGPNPKELGLLIDYAADALEPKVCCGKFETCIDMCAVRADRFKSQRDELLAALEQLATWGRMQHKAQSKGCHATFDMMSLKDEIDLAEAAITSVKGSAA